MKKKTSDYITGGIFLLLGIAIILGTGTIKMPRRLYEPGPRIFPYICGYGLAACGIGLIIQTLLTKDASQNEKKKPFLTKEGWIKLIIGFALMVLYAVMIYVFGYLWATGVCTFIMSMVFSRGKGTKWWVNLLISVAVTAVIYLIFKQILHFILPVGILFKG